MRSEIVSIIESNESTKTSDQKKNKKELMLFLSFDITDSTMQKVKHPEEWPKIIDLLVSLKFQHMNYWKFNGDEILYKRKVNGLEFICRIIESVDLHLKRINTEMAKIIKDISVKATIWLALSETDALHYMHNFSFQIDGEVDFVGKNIDEGFRLTKCSSMQKIAIDPKIVYILLDTYDYYRNPTHRNKQIKFYGSKENVEDVNFERIYTQIIHKLHLVGYSRCKGVWNNHPYPVYWYYDEIQSDEIRYNEYLNGEHLWQKNISSLSSEVDIQHEFNNLSKIFVQMDVQKEIDAIYKSLVMKGDEEVSTIAKANLYYMVACVNPKTNKVMIGKRSSKRKHLKNVWDFGNVKYQNINMIDSIRKEYKNVFGIDIELELDKNRDYNLRPFGYCTIYRNGKAHNSILCHAKISNPNNLEDEELIKYILQNKTNDYEEIRFVNVDDVSEFRCLTLEEIREDSEKAEYEANEPFGEDVCILHFKDSIRGACNE